MTCPFIGRANFQMKKIILLRLLIVSISFGKKQQENIAKVF
jgi:hypothetical protein